MVTFRMQDQVLRRNLSSGGTGLGSLGPTFAKLQQKPNIFA
jgi:hypothetical protein